MRLTRTYLFALFAALSFDLHLAAAWLIFGQSLASAHGPHAPESAKLRGEVEITTIEEPQEETLFPALLVSQAPGPPSRKIREKRDSLPPPPAAQAARTVVTEEPSSEVVPVGLAERYPGGQTHPLGTSATPVFDLNADPDGVPGAAGSGGGGGGVSLAHPAESDWHCPWPLRAHLEGVERARVHLVVRVAADGKPLGVRVLDDPMPGLGFPDAARECAMRQKYKPARDWRNQAVNGRTGTFATIFYTF